MKKFFNYFMLAAAAVVAFASCAKNVEEQLPVENGVRMKTITVMTDIQTKTTLDSNHENIVWSEGDKISIFNDVNDTNLGLDYVAGGYMTVEVPETTKEIYALYPYFEGNTSGPTSVGVYINHNQTQKNPGELNGENFPMVAKGTVATDNKALISLYPVASALALNIYNTALEGEESVLSVTVTPDASNTKFTGKQSTDLTGDSIIKYTSAGSSQPIIVTLTNALALGNTKPADKQKFEGQIYVCLAKQSYAKVKFEIVTDKGTYTITSNDTPFDCVTNDFVPVNINLKNAEFEGMTVIDNTTTDYTTGFEDFTAGTTYNNTEEKVDGPDGAKWASYYGTVSTNSVLLNNQSMQMRWYTNAASHLGYARTNFILTKVGYVSFEAAATNGLKLGLYYKTTGDWILAKTFDLTTSSASYTYAFDTVLDNAQLKFQIVLPSTNPTSTSNVRIDDVVVKAQAPAVQSYTISITAPSEDGCSIAATVDGNPIASGASVKSGKTVSIVATSGSGFVFNGWTVSGASVDNSLAQSTTFVVADSDVNISANFTNNSIDVLTRALTGVADGSSSYADWSGKQSSTSAVFAGNSAGNNNSIQLRSNNNNSGIVTTASGGFATKITVSWESNTLDGRTLNVYGKNTAYTSPANLYGSDAGTLLGTIVKGTSTELTIPYDCQFIGLRSQDGAMYLSEIRIEWSAEASGNPIPTPTYAVSWNAPSEAAAAAGCAISATVGGNTISSGDEFEEGTVVTITATVGTDYTFDGWTVNGANAADATATSTTFTVGTQAVSFNASFSSNGGGSSHLDENGFINVINASAHNYADAESSYTYDGATWMVRGNSSKNYHWLQIRSNTTPSYIAVTAPSKIKKVTIKVSNASNSSGGINDITKHGAFTGTLNLMTASSSGTNVGSTSSITNNIAEITPSGANTTLYITSSGPARIWDVLVEY